MRDRKLYDLLRRLSADERALFAEFLRSPLHAHRPKLADMVELMERLLFAAPEQPCSSEDFYAAFYPGKPYDSNNLNRLISVITSEFKEFLALRFFQRDRTARTACATREMSRRRWDDILPKEIALTRKVLQEELPDDEHNYYQLYCLEYENARHYMENAAKKGDLIYQPIIDAADKFSLLLKAKHISITCSYDEKYKTTHTIRNRDVLAQADQTAIINGAITFELFQVAKDLLLGISEKQSFYEFAALLERHLPSFERDGTARSRECVNKVDSELLYMLCDNAAIKCLGSERPLMVNAVLRNGKIGIEKGILLEEGFLNPKSYQNYIRTSSAIGQINDAREFLHQNAHLLTEKEQRAIPDLCSALLNLIEEKTQEALSILHKLKSRLGPSDDILNHLEVRVMLCIAWYKLGDAESLHHESHAMRTFINRAKATIKEQALPYQRFLKAVMAIESAESKTREKMLSRYKKILWNFEFGPPFTGKGLLRKEILARHGTEMEYWRQDKPGAN